MVTITRRLARRLRAVLGRPAAAPAPGPPPLVTVLAAAGRARVRYHGGPICVEYAGPGPGGPGGPVALPYDALAEFDGRDDSPVALAPDGPGRTAARWSVGGLPQSRVFASPPTGGPPPFPAPPASLGPCGAVVVDALAAAAALAAGRGTRPAPGAVLGLLGGAGAVVACDGRQRLTRRGCRLPWAGDVFTRPWPALARAARAGGGRAALGLTGPHVVLRSGAWTVWAETIPPPAPWAGAGAVGHGPAARLSLSGEDARLLLRVLGALPGAGRPGAPLTLDCRGVVAVRAAGRAGGRPAVLVLGSSASAGPAVSVVTDRTCLARALRLGFTEFLVFGPAGPVTGVDGDREYTWHTHPAWPASPRGPT